MAVLRSRWLLRTALFLGLLLAAGVGAAFLVLDDPRDLFRREPPAADYTWLRRGLAEAEELADRAARDSRQATNMAAAMLLEQAIRQSRANARRYGTEPIPPEIKEQLAPYFPEDLLDDVRWSLARDDLLLGHLITRWYGAEGGAVTLRDTVVYSNRNAATERYLWAHELTHALQYEELGLADFARVYVTNSGLLEQQAWDNANRIEQDIQRRAQAAAAGEAATAPGGESPDDMSEHPD